MHIEALPSPYRPDPKIASLGAKIGDAVKSADFPETILRFRNDRWAATIGLDSLSDADWARHFGRFEPLPDNMPEPLALRYHGHQFRVYNPEIGDGRGFLFAQMRDGHGRLLDLGTKGSGTTPYSRRGDGRLTLKGGVREILATEMLESLGVNTSKSFSLIETGEELMRGDEPSPTRSAVLVRLSHSHIRIGTFQRIAAEGDADMMAQLVHYCLTVLYNETPGDTPAAQLLHLAVERIADLAASYMVAGFVHGVLNTDNINITGESFDYGPWRFTEYWDPRFTAAYFDENGLYAFGRQAEAMHWNLGQLAVSLRLICEAPPLIEALERFPALFQAAIITRFLWRLGVQSQGVERDRELVEAGERHMVRGKIPIDMFFHAFRGGRTGMSAQTHEHGADFEALLGEYPPQDNKAAAHWSESSPCSMLIEEVEQIWTAIAERDDWQPLHQKVESIRIMGQTLSQR
ncbi:YdiU family protein [Sphingorhabdus sp. IMCC26285]|uniref:Protein nucleotidyltransferase YdiU n=1 Tax=Sphingorhabdus profundilacus TaxID=2509718 RepID=A0A6I4LSN8_9SPHN|nr:YdiU family protein [Sphingorhabdus profundilacus]MVZ96432.1 YdiU family protein [Sphingorhabdus profundilacus]